MDDDSNSLRSHIQRSGFPYSDGIIHTFVGGSALHGAKVNKTDDLDIYGVFIEPPSQSLGIMRYEHFVWSTAGNERRNGPDDVDVCLYSLRKWATLAAKGNPTALHFLYAQRSHEPGSTTPDIWHQVLEHRQLFVSRKAGQAFQGFANDQLAHLQGSRGGGKHGQRPEYIGKFGYDTKAAMHVVRLLHEGIEFLETGVITLPRPERALLVEIRTGEYGTLEKVTNLANQLFMRLDRARETSPFPEDVDRNAVNELVASLYLRFYTTS